MTRLRAAFAATPLALALVAGSPLPSGASDPTPGEIALEGTFAPKCVETPLSADQVVETCAQADTTNGGPRQWMAGGRITAYRIAADGTRTVDPSVYVSGEGLTFSGGGASTYPTGPQAGRSGVGTRGFGTLSPGASFTVQARFARWEDGQKVQQYTVDTAGTFSVVPQWPTYGTATCGLHSIQGGRLNVCLYSGVRAQLVVTAERKVNGKWAPDANRSIGYTLSNLMDATSSYRPQTELPGTTALLVALSPPRTWDPYVDHTVQAKATVTYRTDKGDVRSFDVATPVGTRPAS